MLPRLIVIAALLVIPLAGCGSSQKDEYRAKAQQARKDFRSSVEKAGAQVKSGASLQQRVPALRSFKASVDKLASDLDGLDPPQNMEKVNDDAVKQLRTLSGDLGDYEQAATAGDEAKAAKVVPTLQADQTVLQQTLGRLDKQISG